MKNFNKLFLIAFVALSSCKKSDDTNSVPPPATDSYSSVNDFFSKNGVQIQTYIISGIQGGSFTSTQGTIVTIPHNAFVTQAGIAVAGDLTIQFKDVYKKSDMLLSDLPTATSLGVPLKSGGEFFIKAIFNHAAVKLAAGKKIVIEQPAELTGGLDSINIQQAFVRQQDSIGLGIMAWEPTSTDSVFDSTNNYIFNLYQFNSTVDSGTWCNSDNQSFFSSFPQTALILQPDDSLVIYNTQVFLLFQNLSSMVHVYNNATNFPYFYAPQGIQCTLVAIGLKNGFLYSSFVPILISSNQTIHFSLSQTTTSAFKTQLLTLN